MVKAIRFLFVLCVVCNSSVFCQQKDSKIVLDSTTGLPVDYVYISSDDKKLVVLSNKSGRFVFVKPDGVSSVSFYKIGYKRRTLSVTELSRKDTIYLVPNLIPLPEISINSRARNVDTLYKNKRLYIDDYKIIDGTRCLLLTSFARTSCEVYLYDYVQRKQLDKLKIAETGDAIFKDCFGNFHLLTTHNSRQLIFTSDSTFEFLFKYEIARFDSSLRQCALRADSHVVLKFSPPPVINKTGHVQYPDFLAYLITSYHQKKELLYLATFNERLKEMLKAEIADHEMIVTTYKLIGAKPPSAESIWNSENLFFSRVASPVYAPIFLSNDTMIVFDFQKHVLIKLNKAGVIYKIIPLDENARTSREFEVVADGSLNRFYIRLKKFDSSCLYPFNLYNGRIGGEIKLQKKFASNVQIYNGKIFYIAREKGWDDTSYLFSQ